MIPENGASIDSLASFAHLEIIFGLIPGLARDKALALQVDGAIVLRLGQHHVGLRLLKLGLGHRRIQLDQRCTLGHALALAKLDRADASCDFGSERYRFVRAQAADRGDALRQRQSFHFDGFDRDRGSRAWRRRGRSGGGFGRVARAAQPETGDAGDNNENCGNADDSFVHAGRQEMIAKKQHSIMRRGTRQGKFGDRCCC